MQERQRSDGSSMARSRGSVRSGPASANAERQHGGISSARAGHLAKGGWQVHMKGATPRANGAVRKDDGLPEKSAEPKNGEFHCEMAELCQISRAFL